MERQITPLLRNDLSEIMVFLAGPRQCGKTTLAKSLISEAGGRYYSWDLPRDRVLLRQSILHDPAHLWVFDEIHKLRSWRNWLKGVFDEFHKDHSILVTGSARLDLYRRGGDSLQGRYQFHRLHPLTLSEVLGIKPSDPLDEAREIPTTLVSASQERLDALLKLGGFPFPFLSGSERKAARWRLGYGTRHVREDIRDLERIEDLDKMELLFDRLPACVGSVLSINSLREDLEAAFGTIRNWIAILDRTYATFRIPPFGAPRLKAVKKEQKLYFWDWSRVESEPARFENLVASHLLRAVHWLEDVEGRKAELRYFRDTVEHEVDFIVLVEGKPWAAVEVKLTEQSLDSNLSYFLARTNIPFAFQIHLRGSRDIRIPDINSCRIRIMPAARFLSQLP